MVAGCPNTDTLGALVSGALSAAARAEVANHAASCDVCHALIEGLIEPAIDATTAGGAETFASGEQLLLRPGARVGRYLIEARLGAGGMGVVHAAVDSELQRRVALKLLRADRDGVDGSAGRERLMREARTLARLSHPNVVTVFDVGRHQGHLFIAMELVDGGSLSAWLRTPRGVAEIIERMIEAARGLAAAHSAGVVHRDIKPDNILVGLDGRARVTDFGLARLAETAPILDDETDLDSGVEPGGLTRTGTLMGTPVYMAPEQLSRGVTSPHTDQWSFCATLYEALAGVRPFGIDDLDARQSAIGDGRLIAPLPERHVPTWLRQIVLRGLRTDPDARWPSMSVLAGVLAGRHRRRRRIALAVAGALAIVGVAAGLSFGASGGVAKVDPPNVMTRSQKWTDQRPGCDCPYSACKDGCVSVCRAHDYTLGAKVPGINVDGRQEALLGASADGDTILYLAGPRCSLDRLLLARRHGSTFVPVDLTDQLDRSRVGIFEGCCTLSADGQELVLASATRTGFVQARLVGNRVLPPDPIELIARPASGTVRYPVLGADALTLYYHLEDPGPAGDAGPRDGTYQTQRSDRRSAFTRPQRLTGRARRYEYLTGVSSDGLSVFMTVDFETRVLVRASAAEPFGDPAPGLIPASLPGWRAIPLGDCRRILTTSTPGGCEGEDIAYLEAVAAPH